VTWDADAGGWERLAELEGRGDEATRDQRKDRRGRDPVLRRPASKQPQAVDK
jgi:hypothetical protein